MRDCASPALSMRVRQAYQEDKKGRDAVETHTNKEQHNLLSMRHNRRDKGISGGMLSTAAALDQCVWLPIKGEQKNGASDGRARHLNSLFRIDRRGASRTRLGWHAESRQRPSLHHHNRRLKSSWLFLASALWVPSTVGRKRETGQLRKVLPLRSLSLSCFRLAALCRGKFTPLGNGCLLH